LLGALIEEVEGEALHHVPAEKEGKSGGKGSMGWLERGCFTEKKQVF